MARTIVTENDAQAANAAASQPPKSPDGPLERLLKYVPTEIVALYLALQGLFVSSFDDDPNQLRAYLIAASVVGAIFTPLFLWRVRKVVKPVQLAVSTGAFVVWVFALGGPFALWDWYEGFQATALLLVFSTATAFLSPGDN